MEILEIIKKWIRGNKISVLSLGIALLTIIGSVMYVSFNKCEECPKCEELSDQIELKNSNDSAAIQIEETEYKVDVKGAVNNPGVYTLKSNATVGDQTTPNMIQRISEIFARNPLISSSL